MKKDAAVYNVTLKTKGAVNSGAVESYTFTGWSGAGLAGGNVINRHEIPVNGKVTTVTSDFRMNMCDAFRIVSGFASVSLKKRHRQRLPRNSTLAEVV